MYTAPTHSAPDGDAEPGCDTEIKSVTMAMTALLSAMARGLVVARGRGPHANAGVVKDTTRSMAAMIFVAHMLANMFSLVLRRKQ